MDFLPFIKEVGRGASGSRSLSFDDAERLFGAMLAGDVPALELGALLIALRMKGESFEEMRGFLSAATRFRPCLVLAGVGKLRPVVIPSYNGARRGANLTPLLGVLLARLGVPVLVHGPRQVSGRVGTLELLRALALCDEWDGGRLFSIAANKSVPLIAETPVLFPELDALMAIRERLGVRNAAHSLVKIIDPFGGEGIVLSAATHPPYLELASRLYQSVGGRALVFRATEGEPYFNPKRSPTVTWVSANAATCLIEAETSSLTDLPDLPVDGSLEHTVEWTHEVLAGKRPIPLPLLEQLACVWLASGGASHLTEARIAVEQRFTGGSL